MLRKPRSRAEVWNDLDGEVVNLFRVLRDDVLSSRLVHQLRLTPFAREEFVEAYQRCEDAVERARRLVIRAFQGFGSNAHNFASTGFRANSNRSGTTPAHDWRNYPDCLALAIDRLRGVVVESRPAIDVMRAHDGPTTCHYVDPPYVHSTRGRYDAQRAYNHELTDADHSDLLGFLKTLKGAVVLSGYPHPLYDEFLSSWQRVERPSMADGARRRTEVLWLNPACTSQILPGSLFAEMVA